MKVLVTGAQGQLAKSLVERAQAHADVELIRAGRPQLDLAIPGRASEAIQALRPDVVINAAAYTDVDRAEEEPELAFRINADAAGEIARAATVVGAPMIQISTDYVFDGRHHGPYTEDCEPNPIGAYGRSKLAGEKWVQATTSRHAIVRTAWVFSPFARNFVKTMIGAARTRDTLAVVDDQIGSPSSALDLADGLLRMAQLFVRSDGRGLGEVYHLAGTGQTSWYGLADLVMAYCRKHSLPAARVRPIGTEDWPTSAKRPANSVLDSTKFARTFDFRMAHWEQSVEAVIARLTGEQAENLR